jgi:hypothetical protein
MAHLSAFKELLDEEGIAEEACLKFGETFDAAMSEKAWTRLKHAYETMLKDHGKEGDVIRDCRIIEDPQAAERFTQMKGCIGAVIHAAGQMQVLFPPPSETVAYNHSDGLTSLSTLYSA